jgi:hypothetical protein
MREQGGADGRGAHSTGHRTQRRRPPRQLQLHHDPPHRNGGEDGRAFLPALTLALVQSCPSSAVTASTRSSLHVVIAEHGAVQPDGRLTSIPRCSALADRSPGCGPRVVDLLRGARLSRDEPPTVRRKDFLSLALIGRCCCCCCCCCLLPPPSGAAPPPLLPSSRRAAVNVRWWRPVHVPSTSSSASVASARVSRMARSAAVISEDHFLRTVQCQPVLQPSGLTCSNVRVPTVDPTAARPPDRSSRPSCSANGSPPTSLPNTLSSTWRR